VDCKALELRVRALAVNIPRREAPNVSFMPITTTGRGDAVGADVSKAVDVTGIQSSHSAFGRLTFGQQRRRIPLRRLRGITEEGFHTIRHQRSGDLTVQEAIKRFGRRREHHQPQSIVVRILWRSPAVRFHEGPSKR